MINLTVTTYDRTGKKIASDIVYTDAALADFLYDDLGPATQATIVDPTDLNEVLTAHRNGIGRVVIEV
jgi:hypothetical protein